MTDQAGPPGSAPAAHSDLDAYIAANAGRFTEDALTKALVAAGHSPEDVRAALARTSAQRSPSPAPRAVRTILISYVAVFALLSLGMLLNGRPAGHLMPDAAGGIGLLALSLGAAFVTSLVWVATRRGFLILAGVAFVASLVSGSGSGLVGLIIFFVLAGGALLALRRMTAGGGGSAVRGGGQPAMAVLLALPMLLLIGIAGTCLASGLPVPGGAG